jgi:ketosteroid isomerase-like protein
MPNKNRITVALVVCVIAASVWITAPRAQESMASSHSEEILKIHKALLASHLQNDAQGVITGEADDVVVVSRGEVLFPTREERVRQFTRYLENSEFERYQDTITPIVRVSVDGTMAWLIAQVEITEVRTNDEGERVPVESTWAWIELYERRSDRWLRVGEVSSMKPSRADDAN